MSDDERPTGLSSTRMVRHIKPRRRGTGRGENVQRREISVKQALLNAFDKVGGEDYLVLLARKDPKAFVSLLAKTLPTKVEGDEAMRDAVVNVLTGISRNPTDPLPEASEGGEVPPDTPIH